MTGNYLFIHYGYGGDLAPILTLFKEGAEFEHLPPRGQTLTLSFDTSGRHCTGWHNLATGKSSPCPDTSTVETAYTQCMHCQRKTGFNPAFYNANSVSPQQQARNAQPHFLYLAHFGPGVVKAGISWSQRGIRRLLDQGARSYLIIKHYPNANVARQYEAKAASLEGVCETVQLKTKYKLLTQPYDPKAGTKELLHVRQKLVSELGVPAEDNEPQTLENLYLGDGNFAPHELIRLEDGVISGLNVGMVGGNYIAEQNGVPYFLSLANLTGYRVAISEDTQPNAHAPQQTSLF